MNQHIDFFLAFQKIHFVVIVYLVIHELFRYSLLPSWNINNSQTVKRLNEQLNIQSTAFNWFERLNWVATANSVFAGREIKRGKYIPIFGVFVRGIHPSEGTLLLTGSWSFVYRLHSKITYFSFVTVILLKVFFT